MYIHIYIHILVLYTVYKDLYRRVPGYPSPHFFYISQGSPTTLLSFCSSNILRQLSPQHHCFYGLSAWSSHGWLPFFSYLLLRFQCHLLWSSDLTTMPPKIVSSLFLKTKNTQTKNLLHSVSDADQCISLPVPPFRMPTSWGVGPFFIVQLSESRLLIAKELNPSSIIDPTC